MAEPRRVSATVVVTGAGGFLGRVLVPRLSAEGIAVRAVTRSAAPALQGVSVVRTAVLDVATLEVAFQGADAVFHLAAHTHDLRSTNDSAAQEAITLGSTLAALVAAERVGVGHFILASSLAVHGPVGSTVADEDYPCNPTTPYGRAKLRSEHALRDFARRTGAYASAVRPAMIYGVGCPGNLPRLIRAVRARTFPPVPEFGNRRSMVGVADVAEGMLRMWRANVRNGRAYILTDGRHYSTHQLYDLIRRGLGRTRPVVSIPRPLFAAAARVGDIGGWMLGRRMPFDSAAFDRLAGSAFFDSHRAERELGFLPTMTLENELPAIIRHLSMTST